MTPHPHIPYQHIHQEAECDLPEEVTSELLQYDVDTDSQEDEEAGDEYRDGIEYSRKVLSGNLYLVTNYEQSSQLNINCSNKSYPSKVLSQQFWS